jgi:hypothetical protein
MTARWQSFSLSTRLLAAAVFLPSALEHLITLALAPWFCQPLLYFTVSGHVSISLPIAQTFATNF